MRGIKKSDRQYEVLRQPSGWIASVGGIGLLPFAPGTWASAATLPLGWAIAVLAGPWGLLAASLCVFVLGVWASNGVIRQIETDDPSVIVIDEVAGQLLTLVLAPLTWQGYLLAFIAFRLFDLAKPWPISVVDRQVGGGFGAMADDMLAGLFGMLVVFMGVYSGWLS